jgi:hypothetical protein
MTRIKAKTPSPAPRARRPRAKAAKANTVAAQLAALETLVARAHATRCRAEVLAEAISGEVCGAMIDASEAPPVVLVDALGALAANFSAALDGLDGALDKARAALG